MVLQIKNSVLAVYKSIVSLRSVALMQEAYGFESLCLLSLSKSFYLRYLSLRQSWTSLLHITIVCSIIAFASLPTSPMDDIWSWIMIVWRITGRYDAPCVNWFAYLFIRTILCCIVYWNYGQVICLGVSLLYFWLVAVSLDTFSWKDRLCNDLFYIDSSAALLFAYRFMWTVQIVNFWICCRILLSMLNGAYDSLLRESGSETRCHLGVTTPQWNRLSPSQSEITVIFCICVLAEIGNAKNNIIGVCFHCYVLLML